MGPRGLVLVAGLGTWLATASVARAAQDPAVPAPKPAGATLTKAPRLLTAVQPERPSERLDERIDVQLVLTIDATGKVQDTQIVDGGGAGEPFDGVALATARTFVFEPAELGGQPRAVRIRYVFTFDAATHEPEPVPPLVTPTVAPPVERAPEKAPVHEEVEDVRIRATRAPRSVGSVTVTAGEARLLPGTQGDAAKVIEDLPGVARASFGSGQIAAWGSTPRESRIFIDGVEVPALYHLSGLRSVLSTELVGSVRLVPGAFGVEDGRATGGVVHLTTADLPAEGRRIVVAVDTLDAGAMVRAALSKTVSLAVAARGSYVRPLFQSLVPKDAAYAYALPDYGDVQLKATIRPTPKDTVDVLYLGSVDSLHRDLPSTDPSRGRYQDDATNFQRLSMRYFHHESDGETSMVTPWVGYDNTSTRGVFGPVPVEARDGSFRYGVRARYDVPLVSFATLTVGFDAAGALSDHYRNGSLNRPPREGDVLVFGQPPGSDVNTDTWRTHVLDAAPYAALDLHIGTFSLVPGVRLPLMLTDGSRSTPRVGATPAIGFTRLDGGVDPRILGRWDATRVFSVMASAGFYRRGAEGEDLSAVFGSPSLGPSRSRQLSGGVQIRPLAGLSLEMIGFYKLLDDLVVRSPSPTPALAQALVQDGQGRAMGAQVLLRKELAKGFFGWVSYTLSRSERRYYGDESYRLLDYDQPHVLAALASYTLGSWTFGARYRFASGAPRTPVTAAYYASRFDRYEPLFGAQNTIRLPDFHQLDLRIEKAFDLPGSRLVAYLDVQNVTAHKNAEDYVYAYDYSARGTVNGLPTLAALGVRWEL